MHLTSNREGVKKMEGLLQLDSPKHHFEETPVFAGGGVRAVGTNETNA